MEIGNKLMKELNGEISNLPFPEKDKEKYFKVKSNFYNFQIRTKFDATNWRILLLEKILHSTIISLTETVLGFNEKEDWCTSSGSDYAWKNQEEIIMEYMSYDKSPEDSQFSKLAKLIRENLIKITNDPEFAKNFGKELDSDGWIPKSFRSHRNFYEVSGALNCVAYSQFDWRCSFWNDLMSTLMEEITIKVLKYKDTASFSDKLQSENPSEHMEEIMQDFIQKELKNLIRVVRKSTTKIYLFYFT